MGSLAHRLRQAIGQANQTNKEHSVSHITMGEDPMSPAQVLEAHGMSEDDWEVTSFRMETEFKNIRDAAGDTETRLVHEYYLTVKPTEDPLEPLQGWTPIRPASVMNVTLAAGRNISSRTMRRALILPDPQIGFIHHDDEVYTTHSTEAMSVALQAIDYLTPDVIVNLGDFFDFAEWSTKYATPKTLTGTTQASLESGYRFLAFQKALCDEIHVIEGNHEKRISDLLEKYAKAAVGLKQAGRVKGWPIFSLPHMLNLDDLGVQWASGYPGARVALREDIVCMHGSKLSTRDQATKTPYLFHTIMGHIHKQEMNSRTFENAFGEPLSYKHISPGCLCRVTGEVPSFGSSADCKGRPNLNVENWQQGFCTIDYDPDAIGSPFTITMYEIVNDATIIDGDIITPNSDIVEMLGIGAFETATREYAS